MATISGQSINLTPTEQKTFDKHSIKVVYINGEPHAELACSRCGGTGHYSYTPKHGTCCFECNVGQPIENIGKQWRPLKKALASLRRRDLREQREAVKRQERSKLDELIDVTVDVLVNSAKAIKARTEAERVATLSHFGTVGKRGTFSMKYTGCHSFPTQWGETVIMFMEAECGSKAVWFTNWGAFPGNVEKGEAYTFKATVKKHDERDGEPQTVFTRCTFDD